MLTRDTVRARQFEFRGFTRFERSLIREVKEKGRFLCWAELGTLGTATFLSARETGYYFLLIASNTCNVDVLTCAVP